MSSEVLPSQEHPPKGAQMSRAMIAAHFLGQLFRPGRIRRRLLLLLSAIGLLFIGRRSAAELKSTVSAINWYMPHIFDGTKLAYQPRMIINDTLSGNPTNPSSKPKFHLVVTTPDIPDEHFLSRRKLCKCLLSAAVLDYPPPVLVNYDRNLTQRRNVAREGESKNLLDVYDFLSSNEVGDSDLVLIVSEDTWLQLPPTITIRRFLQGNEDASTKLLKKYGTVAEGNPTPSYVQNVIFGAAKICAYEDKCAPPVTRFELPQSPLASDIYGEKTDFDVYRQSTREKSPNYQYNRPRFLSASTIMGKASDLRPIYNTALSMPHFREWPKYDTQAPLAYLYWYQEVSRQYCDTYCFQAQGMGVDYQSSLFQIVDEAERDVRFMRFNRSIVVASPSNIEKGSFKDPIRLPSDLSKFTHGPFALHSPISRRSPWNSENNVILDALENTTWSEVSLATNIIVPGTDVPSMLNFHRMSRDEEDWEPSDRLIDEWWSNMWFYNHSRTLMEQYIRSSGGAWASDSAERGGKDWWNMRGGKGGVWTGSGAWFSWKEVCGDVKGLYGDEADDVNVAVETSGDGDDEGVVKNSSGNVVEMDGSQFEKLRFEGGGV